MGGSKLNEAARMIRGEDIPLMVGCTKANHCTEPVTMPSSPRLYVEAPRQGGMSRMVEDEVDKMKHDAELRAFELTQLLPTGLGYIADSAQPEAVVEEKEGRTYLRWAWGKADASQVHTVTYQVLPREEGVWGIDGLMDFADAAELTRTLPLPAMAITVSGLCQQDTPTPRPPTDTPEPPTETPVPPTDTPVPPTATREPQPIYLPIAVLHPCIPEYWASDLALVLDVSTSMRQPTKAGRSKIDASLEQAKRFVGQMTFDPAARGGRYDQVAVVGFNSNAWIEQELTNDKASILAALDRLVGKMDQHTRLDLAVEKGAEALEAETHRGENTKAIIVLTDGLPDQVPYDPDDGTMETTILKAAAAAKVAGARVYTIAIGAPEDTNPSLLRQIATHPSLYYYEPDPEDLAGVYSEIAGSLGCPMSRLEYETVWPP